MNTTLKSGKYNNGRDNVQYASHGVQGKSYAGFYMFMAGLVSAIIFLVNFFMSL